MLDERHLTVLEGSDWELENKDQDIRGRRVFTQSGADVGAVKDMLVDTRNDRVAAIRLDDRRLVPVEALEIHRDKVIVREGDPDRTATRARADGAETEEMRIPIVEEQLKIGKRTVERGGVRVESRVVEEPVHDEVVLRSERVTIERQPVNQKLDKPGDVFEERSFEVTERSEEAVVAKDARVTEELVVRKDTAEEVHDIEDTVRHTEVDVDDERRRPTRP